MTLAETIKAKVDDLYETYNNLNIEDYKKKNETLKEDINKLTALIEAFSKDIKNLKDISYQDISKDISIKDEDLKNLNLVLKFPIPQKKYLDYHSLSFFHLQQMAFYNQLIHDCYSIKYL